MVRIPLVPIFPGQFRFYGFKRDLFWFPAKFGSGSQLFRCFLNNKKKQDISDNAYECFKSTTVKQNIYMVKTAITGHQKEGTGEEKKMCRVVIVESGMRLRRVRKGYVKDM